MNEKPSRTAANETRKLAAIMFLEVGGVAPWKNPADGKAMLDALRKAGLK
jgi:hypothetical protein